MKYSILVMSILISCSDNKQQKEMSNFLANDINLYRNTPAWELAKSVADEHIEEIRRLGHNKSLLRFQEPRFGMTLLYWAVYNDKLNSCKTLLELGADPNTPDSFDVSALSVAASKIHSSEYVKLLLKYGADVNFVSGANQEPLRTPLIAAARSRLESVKLIVEAGADINFSYKNQNVLETACLACKIDIVKYLIVEQNISFTNALGSTVGGDSLFIADYLRDMVFPFDSEDYRIKMEVVDFLKKHGIDYRKAQIPPHYYTIYDKDFLDKY